MKSEVLNARQNQVSLTYFTGQNRLPKKGAAWHIFKPAEPHKDHSLRDAC